MQFSTSTRAALAGILVAGSLLGAGVALAPSPEAPASPTPIRGSGLPESHAAAPAASALPAERPTGAAATETAPDFEDVRNAVEKGLAFLAQNQDPATGAWFSDIGYKFNRNYNLTARNQPHVGVTSLALMAFLSGGHLPGRGEYGDVVERGTEWLLRQLNPDTGYISAHGSRMYSHAFATLLLAEIYGMTRSPRLRVGLQKAVNMTVSSQNPFGSWRYNPGSPESDMSITVCQVMALRAARNIGIKVPKSTIDRAVKYVQDSAIRRGPNKGGFKYQLKSVYETRTSFAITAAGIATLNHSGVYDNELIERGINYLENEQRALERNNQQDHYFFWYGQYYAAQVFFLAGDKNSRRWDSYWRWMSQSLVSRQRPTGAWRNRVGPGESFSTAIACIILQVPNQFLPIFQR